MNRNIRKKFFTACTEGDHETISEMINSGDNINNFIDKIYLEKCIVMVEFLIENLNNVLVILRKKLKEFE